MTKFNEWFKEDKSPASIVKARMEESCVEGIRVMDEFLIKMHMKEFRVSRKANMRGENEDTNLELLQCNRRAYWRHRNYTKGLE